MIWEESEDEGEDRLSVQLGYFTVQQEVLAHKCHKFASVSCHCCKQRHFPNGHTEMSVLGLHLVVCL